MLTAAEEHGAIVAAVEHRFYNPREGPGGVYDGPVTTLSIANLKYLSSTQAQADLAAFHTHLSNALGLTASNRWITWGGSYPGVMAAWTRCVLWDDPGPVRARRQEWSPPPHSQVQVPPPLLRGRLLERSSREHRQHGGLQQRGREGDRGPAHRRE